MKKLFPYLILLIFSFSKAQNTWEKQSEVLKKINKIDSTKTTLVRTFKIEKDSVRINVSDYTNVIEGEGYIGKSQNKFKVAYYLSSNKLEGIITKEMSQGDLYMQWIFNLENDKIRNEFPSHTVSMCVPVAMDKSLYEIYGYNKSWTEKYLKKLVMKLFDEIKNYH
jgi:hypothetical protein